MRSSHAMWLASGLVWLGLLAAGWHVLLRHEFTPGPASRAPQQWPQAGPMPLDRERPTLLLFAHRNCPCTRATLGEFENILSRAPDRARVRVVLLAPADAAADRIGGEIEARARALPGVEIVLDPDGAEARRFGVRTSGHVLLYDAEGRLLFSGGITDARGHAGDSAGGRAVLAWLRDGEAGRRTTPVYGCSLLDDEGGVD